MVSSVLLVEFGYVHILAEGGSKFLAIYIVLSKMVLFLLSDERGQRAAVGEPLQEAAHLLARGDRRLPVPLPSPTPSPYVSGIMKYFIVFCLVSIYSTGATCVSDML